MVILTPFEVNASSDRGYAATNTLAGSRINTSLAEVGSSIAVVTTEFLKDTGATDNKTLLQYTANTEVGGVGGNFKGISGGQNEDETSKFANPNNNTRVRGLAAADNTRNFFVTDIPWDGYNIDRVEIQRGPNSILFGLGSPAGIINTTTKVAKFQDSGSLEFRLGSYGAHRQVLDYNKVLLANELAIRVIGLNNRESYRQDPAYSHDRRLFATLRYDPSFLNSANGNIRTSLKLNYEKGKVNSNNPRTITPRDQITQWWDGLDQQGYDPTLVMNSGWFYEADGSPYRNANSGQFNRNWSGAVPNNPATGAPWTVADAGNPLPGNGTANPNYSPWLGQPAMFGGVWLPINSGAAAATVATIPEFKNIRGRSSTGTIDGTINGTPTGARRVTVASTAYWAERATAAEGAKYQNFGVWKAATLTDASVFDFYNNLIDGHNKEEWQDFDNFNASLSQTFFDNMFGFEAAYDHQAVERGQYSLDGSGVLYIDINTHNVDGTPNENYGTPYIEGNGLYGNNVTNQTRDAGRVTAFFDYDFNKGGKGGFFRKLLGRHTITGLASRETWKSDSRTFSLYGTDDSLVELLAASTSWKLGGNERTVTRAIYLGESLKDSPTYVGAGIPRAGNTVEVPKFMQWRWFDSTWNAPASVAYDAAWTNTYDGSTSTQSENPANYVGWTTKEIEIVSAKDGGQDYLTREATISKRVVDSLAGSWQGRFWNGAVVGLYGMREDKVESRALAGDRSARYDRVDFTTYDFDNVNTSRSYVRDRTYSKSVVANLNKILPDRWLPINISLFYSESDNFQVTGVRNDLYGNPLAAPTGETNDRGILLSTKDGKYSLRVNKYESTVLNSSNSSINNNLWYLMGGDNFISRLESRADAYQYRLRTRDDFSTITFLDSANPNDQGGWRWAYTPLTGETEEHATLTRMAAVAAWRGFVQEEPVKKILAAWGYPALDQNPMTQTSQASPSHLVANFTATEDQKSEGYEIEFTANPTSNWRISFNAAKSEAQRSNVGGAALTEFTQYANAYHNRRYVRVSGPGAGVISVADGLYTNGTPGTTYYFREATAEEIAADQPNINSSNLSGTVNTTFLGLGQFATWGGGGARNGTMVSWNSNYYSKYLLLKLQEGNNTPELRRWRFNFITNYDFTSGLLKGFNVGAGYRWQDKVAIGYPVKEVTGGSTQEIVFDVENPYYGPSEDAVDLWIGYTRQITPKIEWNIQLNVRDVGAGKKLVPLSAQYDGSIAAWGIAPSQTWTLTNTFRF